MSIHTLIIGRTTGMEAALLAAISGSHSVCCFREYSMFKERTLNNQSPSPDLILVCQQWPEEYRRDQVKQLLESFPLSRIVVCYSAWCASDGRTRDLWPLAVRVKSEFAPQRIQYELEVIQGQRDPLPLTAGYEEIFAFDQP